MSRIYSPRIAAVALLLALPLAVTSPAEAYSPGTATAVKAKYNSSTGNWDYSCSYKGWRSGATVTWKCKLTVRYYAPSTGWLETVIDSHSGSWTPSPTSKTTPIYHEKMTVGQPNVCVVATALSVDGGAKQTVCN